jgi:CHAD domain-containing protein
VLVSRRFAGIGPAVRGLEAGESRASLAEFGAAALAGAHRKLMREARDIDWSDAGQRHAVRIRLKRLRYSCEFFAPAFAPRRVSAYVAALKELQDIFGELNDIAVGRRLLEVAGEEAALLRRLLPAWRAFARRPPFWRAAA